MNISKHKFHRNKNNMEKHISEQLFLPYLTVD